MGSYNKRISDQSKIKFDPINRELIDSENSELDARVESLEENITGSKTATGNPLTVTDAAPVNAVNLSMDLEPIQAGSGTPSPDNIRPISGRSQVIVTNKDNPSEPSVTKNYTIQLGQTVYGGQLDVTKGKMVVNRGYKTIADFELMSEESGNFATGDIGAKRFSPTQLSTIISSHCPTVPQTPDPTQFSISGLHWVDGFQLWNTGCSNFNELKERYGELQVCYELAEPFTIDLTPTQIKMLENTNTITTDYDGDVLSLEYQPNNAFGELLGEVNNIYDSIIADIYDKIDSLDTRVTALEE